MIMYTSSEKDLLVKSGFPLKIRKNIIYSIHYDKDVVQIQHIVINFILMVKGLPRILK